MNVLSYSSSDLNGLTFDLLVDDVPIFELIGTDCLGIPYFLLEDGMPRVKGTEDRYVISVCSCGIRGCGSVYCKITFEADEVVFSDFQFCENNPTFRFSESNYKQVMRDIYSEFSVEDTKQKLEDAEDNMNEEDIKHNRETIKAYVKAVEALLSSPGVVDLIADEIRIPNYTAHEVAKWLTTRTAYELATDLVPAESRLLKKVVGDGPRIDKYIPFSWGLHVYGDDKAVNVICAGYGEDRKDLIESIKVPAPLPTVKE